MRLMIIVAHPDDEIIGAGAIISKAIQSGDSVRIVIMNGGNIESRPDMENDIAKSHKVMGITDSKVYSYENLFLDRQIPDMVKDIERELVDFEPDYIITHFYGDVHPDHKAVFRAVEQASRLTQRHESEHQIKGLYCMNVPSSTNWGHDAFNPDVYVGFDDEIMDRKIEALRVYKNVLRHDTHPRSERALRAQAIACGADVGLPFAEGVKTVWTILK